MPPVKRAAAIVLAVLAAAWAAFRFWPVGSSPANATIDVQEFGRPSKANIVAVEPRLSPLDYRSAAALRDKLSTYLEAAQLRGWLGPKTVVVLPEHVGTWLVAADAPAAAYAVRSTSAAMALVASLRPFAFAREYYWSTERDKGAAALFRMRAAPMARDYQTVFGSLAERYGVVVVAGSIVLPDAEVKDGRIATRRGPL
jgi:hypothetical protein